MPDDLAAMIRAADTYFRAFLQNPLGIRGREFVASFPHDGLGGRGIHRSHSGGLCVALEHVFGAPIGIGVVIDVLIREVAETLDRLPSGLLLGQMMPLAIIEACQDVEIEAGHVMGSTGSPASCRCGQAW